MSDTEVNAVGDVVRRAGGMEAVEIVHRDGTVSRLSDDSVLDEAPVASDAGSSIAVVRGSSWHRVAGAVNAFRIDIPSGSVTSNDGVFTIVCEGSGSSFVVCLDGAATVQVDGSTSDLHAMEAIDISPSGALGEKIEVTEDEVRTDPWVAMNLELGHEPAEVPASARAAAVPTTVTREEPEVVEEAEGAEATEAAADAAVDEAAPEVVEEPEAEAEEEPEPEAEEEPAAAVVEPEVEEEEPEPEVEEPAAVVEPEVEEEPEEAEEPTTKVASGAAAVELESEEEGEEEPEEEAELEHERVVVVGRGPRRQPTLWVALILALIAVALFALGRHAEDQRPVAGTQIDTTRTSLVPSTTARPSTASTATPLTAPSTTAPPDTTPSTSATPTSAVAPPGTTYDITLTRCSQSGSTIFAEGVITNKAAAPQSYRITVAFLGADQSKVAEAVATVPNVAPKQKVSWKGTGSYAGDLKGSGGCQTERVELI